jgi:hypothetical protein
MKQMQVRLAVTAIIDLSGFSSHLEIGDYDIRTEIGETAISRLQILEKALTLLKSERELAKSEYPNKFEFMRFNDSLYFTMDLDDILTPSIGESLRHDVSISEFRKIYRAEARAKKNASTYKNSDEENDDYDVYLNLLSNSVLPLCKFIGFVSRIHQFINTKEKEHHYPGVKTVIAFGLRKPFFKSAKKQDYFSANFSISTAFLASKELHGTNLFIENNILHMLCYSKFAKNIIKQGSIDRYYFPFDPFENLENIIWTRSENKKSEIFKINIFKKSFLFRVMNPKPLGFLQILESLMPFLKNEKKIVSKNNIFSGIFEAIQQDVELSQEDDGIHIPFACEHLIYERNDIELNIKNLIENITIAKKKHHPPKKFNFR